MSTAVRSRNELLLGSVKYIRLTNLDDTVTVEVVVVSAAGTMVFKLLAGESWILTGGGTSMALSAGTSGTATTFTALSRISAHVTTGNADVEVFVASA